MPYAAARESIRISKIVGNKYFPSYTIETLSLVLLMVLLVENDAVLCITFGQRSSRIILIFINLMITGK